MANLTIRFGLLLIVLGGVVWFASTPHAPTSLIPAFFGLLLVLFGSLARTEDTKRRMIWMHVAVTLGLLGFVFPLIRAVRPAIKMMQGSAVARPLAVQEELAMSLICLVFTALCVRSFIHARRSRIL